MAAAACTDHPTGITTEASVRYLQTLSLSVAQRADITPGGVEYGGGVEYDSLPSLSSSAVAFLGMDFRTVYNPEGPPGQEQVYHFRAMAPGQTVATIRSVAGTTAVSDTINAQAAVPHGAFAHISVGFFLNTCAVTTRGAGFCWGSNLNGMLGAGAVDSLKQSAKPIYDTPMPVDGGLSYAVLSGGFEHTCGVTPGGAAYCWGANFNGQLGNGDTTASPTPVAVTGGLPFNAVSAGVYHSCGLATGGAIYCWGNNIAGELGNGAPISYVNSSPVLVSGESSFVAIAAGYQYSCGLTTSGAAYCWGDNVSGELGNGNLTSSGVPVPVAGGLNFVALSAGDSHACGLTRDGAAYCWGSNGSGELGNGTTQKSTSPVAVSGALTFAAISAGQGATCGVTTGGAAYCWGYNGYGQLGNAATPLTNAPNPTPLLVSGGLTFATVSTGYLHTCGVTPQGAAYCWGDNSEGELGDGSTAIHPTSVPVFGP
ncbi:MAG: chromosome condensation regulator RCC1 [Gemmatimonadetes bacterium]|nr:MAG: chromosome condensation regulator RCC1 [Gemmatimonadota bacterium]